MKRAATILFFLLLTMAASSPVQALTGADVSPMMPLETVSPTVQSVTTLTERSLSVTFSEPLLAPGGTTPGNYTVSGKGRGTLPLSPDTATGIGPHTLMWTGGEMRNGAAVTVTASGVQDGAGNPLLSAGAAASAVGIGVAPAFSGLSVTPFIASKGDMVTITFTVSEPLGGDPAVTVNGHPAQWAFGGNKADITYTYTYAVGEEDVPGPAVVAVSGADPAGNLGSLEDTLALTITEAEAGLPVRAWPLALLLLGAGAALFLRARRRGVSGGRSFLLIALFVLPAMLCATASAAPPSVSNVSMVQQDNGAGSTEVVITYDLDTPNGPCDITVSLSKDGGADGFGFPVTSVTGDVAGVAGGAEKQIVWDIRADYPEESMPNARVRVTADDGLVQHTLTYTAGANGTITGDSPQTVNDGEGGTPVTAAPDFGYHFTQWSDGVLTATRQDTGVTDDVTVTAEFAINTYTLTYTAGANGSITGDSPQNVNHGANGTAVTAVPDVNYHFTHWSDGVLTATRQDLAVTGDITVTAEFALNTYTLTYTAGANGSITGVSPQVVNHGADGAAVTAVPNVGYHFIQWSDGVLTATRQDLAVTADVTVTAAFAINTYTLTYTAGANGSITGVSPQTVNHGGSGTLVTAVPGGGHGFLQWSDGVLTATRTDTNVTADVTVTASFAPPPVVTSFAVNGGAATTMPLGVRLDNTATNSPTEYMASESATFAGAVWTAHATVPLFSLSFGVGTRTVYFKVRNGAGESGVVSDTIFLVPNTVPVAAGSFLMGRTSAGDDLNGSADELPVHSVTLGAYRLGKYEVTNKEYCDVLNWARARGYLITNTGTPWAGTGDICFDGDGPGGLAAVLLVAFTSPYCDIQYSGGVFTSKTRVGLPGTTDYSMDTHPMVMVTWYGSVAYCHWLSQWQGLATCYNLEAAEWPLVVAPGYRLPTEAEWERAAAWDTTVPKHWIYGFMSDSDGHLGSCNHYCLYFDYPFPFADTYKYVNPLGLTTAPYTSPAGWFNNKRSAVGAYDMSGNVWEWCGDWYLSMYYTSGGPPWTNPTGPATGTSRVLRGGSWNDKNRYIRSAARDFNTPGVTDYTKGFRVSQTPGAVPLPVPVVTSFAINNGAETTMNPVVTLNNMTTGSPAQYMASESAAFAGATWQPYGESPAFTLSFGTGTRTVYFKARNGAAESGVVSDTILLEEPAVPTVASFAINNGAVSTTNPVVTLDNTATDSPVECMASEDPDFSGASWQAYAASPSFTLSSGVGTRTVWFKVRNGAGESSVASDTILLEEPTVPTVASFAINNGAETTTNPVVTLDNTATGSPTEYMASEDPDFSGASWQTYGTAQSFTLSSGVGTRTVWFKVRNGAGESNVASDTILLEEPPVPTVASFAVNRGAATTMPLGVTLDNTATDDPVEYMASESATFTGASWQAYGTSPAFTLSFGVGTRTVYFKVRSGAGAESGVVNDSIFLVPNTVPVAAGTFSMGRTSAGDDAYGSSRETPVHSVTLGAYSLGKFEVTNKEYCDVLNWALAQGYLSTSTGAAWTGTGDVYAGGTTARQRIGMLGSSSCNIRYTSGVFTSKTRVGLPGSTNYSMDTHPMVSVTWYGAVAYCNWLSEWQGLTPCYDMTAANWPLTVVPPTAGGYRLPTEAEWERAAAWDGFQHWIYGFLSDTNASGTADRCNDRNSGTGTYDNPLGLTTQPYTSPVGWFNGVNVNPNGSVMTVNSQSPVGAYDMSGNVWEWCGDWYLSTYYTSGGPPWTNPTGPATGTTRVLRGGSWLSRYLDCRSAGRDFDTPGDDDGSYGFRVSRTP